MQNFYQILNVNSTASTAEIKRAYRRLAFKYHPDTNENIDTSEHFNLINEAYETLVNTELRNDYDIKFFYGKNFTTKSNRPSQDEINNNYKKYGKSTRNPTANEQRAKLKKQKEIKFPLFEKFMFYVLVSFGILGFINAIHDLFTKEWDGVNSLTGFFFSIVFTGLLIVAWRNYKSIED